MTQEMQPLNYFDPEYIANPHGRLSAIREAAPVVRDAMDSTWIVTRYDDVRALLLDRSLSSDPDTGGPGSLAEMLAGSLGPDDRTVLFMDDPEHGRLRRLVSKAFTPRAVEAMRAQTREIAEALLNELGGVEEFDFMQAFAQPLPTKVIAGMIGVDPADHRRFKSWSDEIVHMLDPMATPEQQESALTARGELEKYFLASIAERRENPGDDLVSGLIAAQEDSDSLTDVEMTQLLRLLLNAGNLTTTDLLGNGLLALLHHPSEFERLWSDPGLVAAAVEEMLRYAPPVVDVLRTTTQETMVAGCPISAGQSLSGMVAAANRDPRHFADPDRFDIGRQDVDHLSFGGGAHYCLGSALARMEAQVGFAVLIERLASIQLAPGRDTSPRMNPSFHGLKTFPVRVRWR